MIIENGTIAAKTKAGGGFDDNDYPIKPEETFGAPIPCNVQVNKRNNLGKQNGNTFKVASYIVLIEPQPFEAERVQINRLGKDLGEFSVMFTEWLEAVGALRIVV
ncbi:MAG: hypothetical protein LBO74_08530 [Candidatus Symbiothrix sp.]|jgi:hypothetical protein|nr:hypothetical protein [Candidatus Symbiothrix sp.]